MNDLQKLRSRTGITLFNMHRGSHLVLRSLCSPYLGYMSFVSSARIKEPRLTTSALALRYAIVG
jgi:hypothetical protein